ncbi:unnamed protein product [Adineta ricciae]|uniref:Methyltransferase small domain-containing protein n=1 Tax=Adineta ricciae TaxID=249248 RepID=A0A815FQ90_ADIRI|nr:unnamed protein product [Adineta ricciae]CAF1357873.1 unnamed protein product [Adineta ricciae]
MNNEILLQFSTAVKNTGYNFITVTPATHAHVNSRPGNRWARSLTDVLGWSRPFHANSSVVTDELFDLMRNAQILRQTEDQREDSWQSLVRISSLDGELFLHSAYPTLALDSVFFGPDTYRFARAIRTMIAKRDTNTSPVHRAIDIGCGAGPGAVILSKAYPHAEILATDINKTALDFTDINAHLANVKVTSAYSNLLDDVTGQFDIIISNPPYLVDSSERQYRHGGGVLGSELSANIVRAARHRLTIDGTLVLYTGSVIINGQDLFREEVAKILENSDLSWTYEEVDPDVFGEELLSESYQHADRIAAVVLTATKTNPS